MGWKRTQAGEKDAENQDPGDAKRTLEFRFFNANDGDSVKNLNVHLRTRLEGAVLKKIKNFPSVFSAEPSLPRTGQFALICATLRSLFHFLGHLALICARSRVLVCVCVY